MASPDFEDFILEGGWDLLFPDDESGSIQCPSCGQVIAGSKEVEWVNKKDKVFKCPGCGGELSANDE